MKMVKTLVAFSFAIGLLFVGNMDVQAYGSYSGDSDSTPERPPADATHNGGTFDGCAGSCHGFGTTVPSEETCGTATCHGVKPVSNTAPVAVTDTVEMDENTSKDINVLSNDTDAEANTLTVTAVATTPGHGTAVLNTDGTIKYTPVADYVGADSFTYTISDGTATATGTVNVTVKEVVAPPTTPDTDGDGQADDVDTDDDNDTFSDADEIAAGTDPLDETSFPTTTKVDTDKDGQTDDVDTDDDNDTFSDAEEVKAGTNPLDPKSFPTTEAPEVIEDEITEEVTEESTNPETGGTAGLMLSLAATTVAGAGMVVFRKKN